MSKGVAHAGKGTHLSSGNAFENERRGWDEESYRRKNENPVNNYDWSRRELNFEIGKGGVVRPLGSSSTSLYDRYQALLKDLSFHQYKDGATNQQHTYVEVILSGSTDRMQQLAFGNQEVNYERNPEHWHNWHVERMPEIEQWAQDSYKFMCGMYGEENIIGFEVHLDETEPHIHANIVPTATKKQRGNVGGYVKVDAEGNVLTYQKGKHVGEVIKLSKGKYDALSDEKKKNYRPAERGTVRTISFAQYFGSTTAERSQKMSDLHDKYYEHVGKKWGLERGDRWKDLPEEERRSRRRKTKKEAYEEKMAKAAKEKTLDELNEATVTLEGVKAELEKWKALQFDEKSIAYPSLTQMTTADGLTFSQLLDQKLNQLVEVFNKPKGSFEAMTDWRQERRKEAKAIVSELDDALFGSNGIDTAHKKAILQLGKDLYAEARSMIAGVYNENEKQTKINESLSNSIDEKNKKIDNLQQELNKWEGAKEEMDKLKTTHQEEINAKNAELKNLKDSHEAALNEKNAEIKRLEGSRDVAKEEGKAEALNEAVKAAGIGVDKAPKSPEQFGQAYKKLADDMDKVNKGGDREYISNLEKIPVVGRSLKAIRYAIFDIHGVETITAEDAQALSNLMGDGTPEERKNNAYRIYQAALHGSPPGYQYDSRRGAVRCFLDDIALHGTEEDLNYFAEATIAYHLYQGTVEGFKAAGDMALQAGGGGGGGSSSESGWGRKEDEDDRMWMLRCRARAKQMLKPSSTPKQSQGQGLKR